jgi:hypothetical protein
MYNLRINFEKGNVSRETIDSTLAAYNNCCAEMRSEARDVVLQQDQARIMDGIYTKEEVCHKILRMQKNIYRDADLHFGIYFDEGGDLKKAKLHVWGGRGAAKAVEEGKRSNFGVLKIESCIKE